MKLWFLSLWISMAMSAVDSDKSECSARRILPGKYQSSDDGSSSTFSEITISLDEKNDPKVGVVLNTVRSQMSRPVFGNASFMSRSDLFSGVLRFRGTLYVDERCQPDFDIVLSRISVLRRGGCEFFVQATLPIFDGKTLAKSCPPASAGRIFRDLNSYRYVPEPIK